MTALRGIGVGLRMQLASELLESRPPEVQWLEVHPENYVHRGGRYPAVLQQARVRWPIVTHGLTMGFGGACGVSKSRMADLAEFLDELETPWHSDHLCFAEAGGVFAHDLLPIPWNDESLALVVRRVREMQDALRRPVLIENLTQYARFEHSDRSEVQFITEVLDQTGAFLLLDVNNVYVNARNFDFDPFEWIASMPIERIKQIHVAGHLLRSDGLRIDTHAEPICNDVYDLLEFTLQRTGEVPVLLERDENFLGLGALLSEVRKLAEIYSRATKHGVSSAREANP